MSDLSKEPLDQFSISIYATCPATYKLKSAPFRRNPFPTITGSYLQLQNVIIGGGGLFFTISFSQAENIGED